MLSENSMNDYSEEYFTSSDDIQSSNILTMEEFGLAAMNSINLRLEDLAFNKNPSDSFPLMNLFSIRFDEIRFDEIYSMIQSNDSDYCTCGGLDGNCNDNCESYNYFYYFDIELNDRINRLIYYYCRYTISYVDLVKKGKIKHNVYTFCDYVIKSPSAETKQVKYKKPEVQKRQLTNIAKKRKTWFYKLSYDVIIIIMTYLDNDDWQVTMVNKVLNQAYLETRTLLKITRPIAEKYIFSLIKKCPRLTAINLHPKQKIDHLRLIETLPQKVTSLKIPLDRDDNIDLFKQHKFTSLELLWFRSCNTLNRIIIDRPMKKLAFHPSALKNAITCNFFIQSDFSILESLDIRGTPLNLPENTFSRIFNPALMTKLKKINVSGIKLKCSDLNLVYSFSNTLKVLKMKLCGLHGLTRMFLELKLRSLDLSYNLLSPQDIIEYSRFNNELQVLKIKGMMIDDNTVKEILLMCPSIKKIDVSFCPLINAKTFRQDKRIIATPDKFKPDLIRHIITDIYNTVSRDLVTHSYSFEMYLNQWFAIPISQNSVLKKIIDKIILDVKGNH